EGKERSPRRPACCAAAPVGRLLAALKEQKLDADTVVVYFSDNGPNGWRWNGGDEGPQGQHRRGRRGLAAAGLGVAGRGRGWPPRGRRARPGGRRVTRGAGRRLQLPGAGAPQGGETVRGRRAVPRGGRP